MSGLPTITAQGRLTRDPELKFTKAGDPLAKFAVACNKRRKNPATGEWENGETLFMDCVAWGWLAESVAENYRKGSLVLITGELRPTQWEADGQVRRGVELSADSVALVPDRKASGRVVESPF